MTEPAILLDTSVAVAMTRGDIVATQWLQQFQKLYVSVTVVAELQFGALNSSRPAVEFARLEDLFQQCIVLGVDMPAALAFADLKFALKQRGRRIPDNDLWIASTSVSRGIPLATLDKHFLELTTLDIRCWKAISESD